jgi:hypothetical protein
MTQKSCVQNLNDLEGLAQRVIVVGSDWVKTREEPEHKKAYQSDS